MSRAVKIAISLPAALLEDAERERQACGESRSEFFRRAVECYLRQERRRAAVAQYVRAHREHPETPEEIATAEALAPFAFGEDSWE